MLTRGEKVLIWAVAVAIGVVQRSLMDRLRIDAQMRKENDLAERLLT